MNRKKNIVICLLVAMMMLICINAASANDTLNPELATNTTSDDVISISEADEELSDSGSTITVARDGTGDYDSISAAVSNANGGETIYIKNGEYTESSISAVKKQLTFTGESQDGVIIKSNGTTGFLTTTESGYTSLTFNSLTFKDINGGSNAVINIGGNGDVNIVNCTFDSCYSRYGSLRIFTSGNAMIDSCQIINSQSSTGSFSSAITLGGAYESDYTLKNTIIDGSSKKSTNTASYIIAVLYIDKTKGTVSVDNITISNSNCVANGLIVVKGKTSIKNSKLINNNVSRDGIYGLIFNNAGNSVISIETTQIENNTGANYLLTSNSESSSFKLNYNNIQDNTFKESYTKPGYTYDVDANYWGSNTLPEGINASTWIVENNGKYELNTGEAIGAIIPGLNDIPAKAIYVSSTGNDENDGLTKDTAVKSIQKALEIAEDGKIIILNDYTVNETIQINRDVQISGEGTVTIDANQTRIFENTANLALTNLIFTNAKAAFGSVLLDDGNATITDCTFYNNRATATSGGNIINNRKGTMTIENSKFYENIASRGVIASQSGTELNINNCEFYNNDMTSLTTTYGMIYSNSADTVVENTEFRNNKAKSGGAIYATRASSGSTGTLEITNCLFENNTSKESTGGAIFAGRTPTTIKDSSFIDNHAVNGTSAKGQGGAIYQTIDDANSKMTIENSKFINNTADDAGAAIYINTDQGTFDIKNSVIINKEGDSTYAIDKKDKATTVITAEDNFWGSETYANITGFEHQSKITMDAIYTPVLAEVGDEITITVTFSSSLPDGIEVKFVSTTGKLNEVIVTKDASASVKYTLSENDTEIIITSAGNEITLPIRSEILDIVYVSPEGKDSNLGTRDAPIKSLDLALTLAQKGQIVLLEGTYKTKDLGSIYTDLNITGEGIVKIDAENNNRILYVGSEANVVLKNLILVNGYSATESGALIGSSGKLTIINSTLANSTSAANGGAIYSVGQLTIINSTLDSNTATLGGAIYADKFSTYVNSLILENVIFTNNVAKANGDKGGAAIYAQALTGEFTIAGSSFKNNKVTGQAAGGAIYALQLDSNVEITDSVFADNTANPKANYGGGAICFIGGNYQKQGSLKVTNSVFESNHADIGGGAIYVRASTLDIANSAIIDSGDSEGIAIYKGDTPQVTASITANKNWWGTNYNPESFTNGATVNTWAIMTFTNASEIKAGEKVLMTVAIDSYTDGVVNATLDAPIKVSQPVTIRTNLGTIELEMKDGVCEKEITIPEGLKYISVTVDDAEIMPYLIKTETSVEISDIVAKKGDMVEFTIKVNSNDGTIIEFGNIDLYVGEDLIATIAVNDGEAVKKVRINNDEGTYDLTAKYSDEKGMFIESNKTASMTISGLNNIVTQENFYDFFDESGSLLDDISFDELIFKGEFKDLGVSSLYIFKELSIIGDEAVLNDMGICIISDNVNVSDIKFIINGVDFEETHGAAILVDSVSDVVLENLDIAYTTPEGSEAFGVYILESENVELINSSITFDANNNGDGIHTYAVHIRDSNDVLVKGNLIDAFLPSLNVDFSYYGSIDSDLVLAVGIQAGESIQLVENVINSNVKSSSGTYATLDTIMIYGTSDILISRNNITETDLSGEGVAGYSNVVDLYSFEDALIEYNNIYVKTTTGVEGAGSAYPIQLTGSYSGLVIDHNNLTSIAGGPALGIYSQNYFGTTDITVTNNIINVTGLATGNYYALVSGMELQDTVAKVYNNTIYSYNVGDGVEGLFGISYAQSTGGSHKFDIQNNTIYTEGKYAVYLMSASSSTVTGNSLFASELKGDEAVNIGGGSGNTVKDNYPLFPVDMDISVDNVFVGLDNLVTITLTNAIDNINIPITGNVTITVNGKTYTVDVNDGIATKTLSADDLTGGENTVEVVYNGDGYYKNATGNASFKVLDGVINSENFYDYFDEKGNLEEFVPENVTLDFQGEFVGPYTVNIDKPVNVISSTEDAVFDSNNKSGNNIYSFNILAGADHTNITGISFKNYCLYIKGASYVTVDDVDMVANVRGVGSGTGFLSIHSNAYYTTVKNSHFENGGTGSSVVVLGKGGRYATFDNNEFEITGSSGNVLSSNIFVGTGDNPEFVNYINNNITSHTGASDFMYGITVCGQGNVIENNTLTNFKGNGIVNQFGATSTKNVYRNNVITGGGSMAVGTHSIVENNHVEATVTVTEGCNVTGNTFNGLTISGKNVKASDNTIKGAVTLSSAAQNTEFKDNHVSSTVTVNSNNNVITGNQISSSAEYAVDLKSTSGNTVQNNKLSSADKQGDDAVKYAEDKENIVSDNGKNAIINIDVSDSWIGNDHNIIVKVDNATGNVSLIVNDVDYGVLTLDDGVATFKVNASDIIVGINEVTATYLGSEEVYGDYKETKFYGLDNVVFQEVFYDFFDENGNLKEDVPYDEIIFKGSFSKLTSSITINRPISIKSDASTLSLMGIVITSDNVSIDGLTLTTTTNSASTALGKLIDVQADNVTLSNLIVTYKVTKGDYNAIAINVEEADNVKLLNNTITFESRISSDSYDAIAINFNYVTNSVIDNNKVTSTLPALFAQNYDWDYFMMGLNTVNPIRIRASENINFTNNELDAKVYSWTGITPTAQSLLVIGSENILIDSNEFKMIDTKAKQDQDVYLYAINFGYSKNVNVMNNNFEISTNGGKNAAGAAYALQGVESQINIVKNNITSVINGPNLGIYVSSMMGGNSELYIAENNIDITGYATSSDSYALVSGIEVTNGNAKIYNNTITVNNKAGYVENAPVYGVSYAQYMYGERSLDIKDNTIIVNGKYTVSLIEGTPANVTGNILYAEELSGDESVADGINGTVENNYPIVPEIIIEGETVWIGSNSTITVNVPSATGNVTVKVGNEVFNELPLVDGKVTIPVSAGDLHAGSNEITVTYNGELLIKAATQTGNLQVIDGVVTNDTYRYYFENGKLVEIVPEGATLDFQGLFLGPYTVNIDKPVNAISSTGDAVFDSNNTSGNNIYSFNILAGADNTNITGLSFKNYCLYIKGASYVTVDDVDMVANVRGVGSGTGFLSIHSNAYYTTVKNSHFENGGTGSSVVVLGKGGRYATFDNNEFEITGASGNVLSSNIFVGTGDNPEFVNYTNNKITSHIAASSIMYGITVCGQGNIIENNTLTNFKGNGIVNQFGATSTKNIYRNNVITGGGSMAVGTFSIVENNNVEATVTVTEGCNVTGNTFNGLTISGKNVIVKDNIINGIVNVNSNGNTIENNMVTATTEYAIDLKSNSDNTVTSNRLVAASKEGDDAVKYAADKNNVVEGNYRFASNLEVSVEDITIGETAIVNVSINNVATGNVVVIVDGKSYVLPIKNGFASVEIPNLKINKYTVGVKYDGDEDVQSGENKTVFNVNKIKSDAIITIGELKVDENVDINITIAGATGEVNVYVDGEKQVLTLKDGVATFTVSNITAGDHSVTAIYMGDATHDVVFNSTVFTVEKIPTSIELTNITIDQGAAIPIHFTIAPDATGRVIINLNNTKTITELVDGACEIELPVLAKGTYSLTVSYDGDEKYTASQKTIQITVNGFDAGLKASGVNITVGEDETITIQINSEATGSAVVILDKEYPITFTNGNATLAIPNLGNGTYTAVVKYNGDDKFYASEVNVTFTVSKKDLPKDVNVSVDIPEGTTAPEFTITLPEDATGNFTVFVDGTPYTQELVNGSATVKVPEQKPGNHTISTAYTGCDKYDGFESENSTLNIPKASIPGGESAINMTSPEGTDSPTYSIKLNEDAKGNLTVTVDGKDTYSAPLVNGSASVTVPGLAPGKHDINVAYTGDDKYSSLSKNTTYNVPTPVVKLSNNKDVSMLYTAKAEYRVLVTVDGKAVSGERVVFTFNGKTYNVNTDKNGNAILKLPTVKPKKAKYAITAEYKGTNVSNNVKVNSIIKAKNVKVKKSKKVNKIEVKTKKVNGKFLKGKKLTLKIKGKKIKAKINKKGVATFKVKKNVLKKLKVGKKYKFKVTYKKDTVSKKLTVKR